MAVVGVLWLAQIEEVAEFLSLIGVQPHIQVLRGKMAAGVEVCGRNIVVVEGGEVAMVAAAHLRLDLTVAVVDGHVIHFSFLSIYPIWGEQ